MSIREQTPIQSGQTAWDDPPILRTHRAPPAPPPQTRTPARQAKSPQGATSPTGRATAGGTPPRKGAGHQAGLHPEDEPYYTTGVRQAVLPSRSNRRPQADVQDLEEEEDDEIYTQARMPTVVRKYNPPVARGRRPPPTGGTQVRQEVPVRRLLPTHFLLTAFGVFLLVIVLALFLTTYVFPAIRRWNDDRVYGYPRTLHSRANVGHGTRDQPYSDFTAENVRGSIYVVEIGEGSTIPQVVHAYYIIRLTGEGNDAVSITAITFSDLNGDGKPDMLVTLENGSTFIFYNTGSEFSQQNPVKK